MNTDRIKEIQQETAYPESVSVQQALLKVWNETEQEQLRIGAVMPSVCVHPITYANYTKFCPRKCLLCGDFVKQTGA
jgi:coproporphyrinogen III oxidase-like Fe-S oxidoreductase